MKKLITITLFIFSIDIGSSNDIKIISIFNTTDYPLTITVKDRDNFYCKNIEYIGLHLNSQDTNFVNCADDAIYTSNSTIPKGGLNNLIIPSHNFIDFFIQPIFFNPSLLLSIHSESLSRNYFVAFVGGNVDDWSKHYYAIANQNTQKAQYSLGELALGTSSKLKVVTNHPSEDRLIITIYPLYV